MSSQKYFKQMGDAQKSRVISLLNRSASGVRSSMRKAITGDEKKRIRDLIREKENEPSYIRQFDKISFTLGVLNLCVCQYFLFSYPQYFWLWYLLVLPVISLSRVFHFKETGLQYFLMDFCYFVNVLVFVNIFGFPLWDTFFKVMFIFTNGPLMVAIVVWRSSLVFHDYDKITSVFIHLLPSLLYYTIKWYGYQSIQLFGHSSALESKLSNASEAIISDSLAYDHIQPSLHSPFSPTLKAIDYVCAAGLYLFWQICYYIKTEIIDREKLDKRPELLTSLRWLSTDTKNAFARSVLKMLRSIGVYGPSEDYDPTAAKTKIVFMTCQFIYTVLTFSITPLFYWSQSANMIYIILIFSISVYNGACFYIEIFSKRYELQLESLKHLLHED